GDRKTVTSTAVPRSTDAPAAGNCALIVFAGTPDASAHASPDWLPSASPLSFNRAAAAGALNPVTSGTVTGSPCAPAGAATSRPTSTSPTSIPRCTARYPTINHTLLTLTLR